MGYSVAEDRIDIHAVLRDIEKGTVTEAFTMGTAAVIAPVGRVGYRSKDVVIHGFEAGPVARALYEELTGIQYGRRLDRYGWTRVVHTAESREQVSAK